MCDAVGVKRGQTKQTKKGRLYRITSESWQFASAVLVHRQRQREQRMIDRERELELEAQRFQALTEGELQTKIEAEITAAKQSDAPTLVFLAEQWIKYVADLSNPDSQSHPPRLYSIYDFIGGGVTKSQRVTPGLEIQLSQTGILYSPIPHLPSEPLTIEQLATGRNDSYEYHDY